MENAKCTHCNGSGMWYGGMACTNCRGKGYVLAKENR